MLPRDQDAVWAFFMRVPKEDRFYLKEDVTDKAVIDRWATELDYNRALPLLAFKGDEVIADGTLHIHRAAARKHVGEVRVVVDSEFRNKGIGRWMLHKLAEVAKDKGLEKLVFEVVADTEEAAQHTAKLLGFVPVAILNGHVRDINGAFHDLLVMEARVKDIEPDMPDIY
jgi:GNAT superfamily N-acetyltransferase